ncbi:hypothetical protein BDW74DRAFT_175222 [Aspergillus multicolor]|uniref:uncharacterized protein n=1 Tax=Aspergillus multicolor TaxID=41759 RepID=UPI003CCE4ECF
MTKDTSTPMRPMATSRTSSSHPTIRVEYALDDILDDPFFSKTSFPSAGIASAGPGSEETTRSSRWLAALTDIPEVYAAANQLLDEASRASMPRSPPATPMLRQTGTSNPETDSNPSNNKGKEAERLRPELSLMIPDWADGTPMQRMLSTHENNSTRPPSAALRRYLNNGYLYSTAREDILREIQTARRENETLKTDMARNNMSLEIAQRKIDMLAAMVLRDRDAFGVARNRVEELEGTRTASSRNSPFDQLEEC